MKDNINYYIINLIYFFFLPVFPAQAPMLQPSGVQYTEARVEVAVCEVKVNVFVTVRK